MAVVVGVHTEFLEGVGLKERSHAFASGVLALGVTGFNFLFAAADEGGLATFVEVFEKFALNSHKKILML
jgi:hypothetical protein